MSFPVFISDSKKNFEFELTMNIQRLNWDSDFFGYEVGKIEVSKCDDFNFDIFEQEVQNYRLIYLLSDMEIDILNLLLVDKKVIFYQKINKVIESNDIIIESFDEAKHDLEQLKALAIESGIYSRFFIDKNFVNNEFINLYSQWIENSVNKKIAFDIIVALDKKNIIGFATLNKKSEVLSDIGLIAVSKAYRGLGIGKKVINEAILRSKLARFKAIQVVTQLDNFAAVNLYKSTNFEIKQITYIYHYWNL